MTSYRVHRQKELKIRVVVGDARKGPYWWVKAISTVYVVAKLRAKSLEKES